ncbi:high-affinity choline transporter 1 isoform X2 [Exaiptasia diaphana]|nr:high-affinity choline transporter 1 isoform X2 [Exaiptasia diaphana]KXJ09271.1 High-affinity choline transporter 1 [Exaiptasia diaphana]
MVYVVGVVGIVLFYLIILGLGIWASRRRKEGEEETILAGRNIGVFLGSFTLTATWVGGGYINGTAEAVYDKGLVSAQAPWGYATSLAIGGLFFAKIMRKRKYVTMIDPFQERYGKHIGSIMYFPALMGEIFWSAAILSALGATVSVVIGLGKTLSIIVSSCIAVCYTLIGGLYSVAYTDVIQLICIFVGLWLSIPFALSHDAVTNIEITAPKWLGEWPVNYGYWIDHAFLLVFGGVPWQVYFQRVLACKNEKVAQILSFAGAFGCVIMTIPAVLIGAAGASADWTQTGFYPEGLRNMTNATLTPPDGLLILPLVLRYLTPNYIAFFGLGAISAAVMSSTDSSILSASSMFTHNIYKTLFRKNASARELLWVIRISIIVVGALATLMGLTVNSVYSLFALCSDLVFVILFPQLVSVIYVPFSNTYGSLSGYLIGLVLRVIGGEELIGLPAMVKYPYYSHVYGQMFPFRTLAMVCSFLTILLVSYIAEFLFKKGYISMEKDFLHCFESYDFEKEGVKNNNENPHEKVPLAALNPGKRTEVNVA